ncbi:MAG TPA: HNH endonuclease signature motif containing protein, partial [Nocardioides sp.]|nr:HNH endonuclease signature motif containing protein [Nocardioides sp.]
RCRAEGCTIPATWCEAHHLHPWSQGGPTDLANGVLLCSYHHHRAHDHRYTTDRLPNGDYRFHRRM